MPSHLPVDRRCPSPLGDETALSRWPPTSEQTSSTQASPPTRWRRALPPRGSPWTNSSSSQAVTPLASAHCGTFREHFRPDANGSMAPVDGSMNTDYANELIRTCPASGRAMVDYDEGSASAFDNRYFGNLLDRRGLLRTGAVLVQNATTRAKVAAFAHSQESFFGSRADSFAKLTTLGVKTSADGKIRRSCSSVNG